MGRSRGKAGASAGSLPRARERANLSFFIVIVFFAVFMIIVITEIFLIDERSRGGGGGLGGMGGQLTGGRRPGGRRRQADFDDGQPLGAPQAGDDYVAYHPGLEDVVGALRGVLDEQKQPRVFGGASGHDSRGRPGAQVPRAVETLLPPAPNITAEGGKWQSVPGTRFKFFVFSAYYDGRMSKQLRIIAATKTRVPERVWCRMWFSNGTHSASVPAKVKVIRENWNLKYSACFILCPVRDNQTVPNSVSIVSKLRLPATNHLLVHNRKPKPTVSPEMRMAVCVKPLHFTFNQTLQMLEFLELYRLLGVSHVTFYNHTIGTNTSCVLKDYERRGFITMLPWKLDMVSQREIRTEGLFAALNDCLYRSMYKFTHVALVDIDEFIMPKHNDTLIDFIRWMNTHMNTRTTGSYSFQNAFFYLQWPDDKLTTDSNDEFETNLITMRKTRRRAKLHPHKQRSKYICRPEFVVEAGNHFVWEFVPGHGTLNVPADAAILNHYRVCEFGGDDCVKLISVVDRTASRYRKRLADNVRTRWNDLKDECGLPEVRRPTPMPVLVDKTPAKTDKQTAVVEKKAGKVSAKKT